jgi:hypothetical protein
MLTKGKLDAVGVGRDEQTRSSPTASVPISMAESHGLEEQPSLGESEEDDMESCDSEDTVRLLCQALQVPDLVVQVADLEVECPLLGMASEQQMEAESTGQGSEDDQMETDCTEDEGKPKGLDSHLSIAGVLSTWRFQFLKFQALGFQVLECSL